MSKSKESDYWVKQELVFREYERSLDLELAMTIVPLSDEQRKRMESDEELIARIAVLDANNQADMIEQLRDLARGAESEGIRFAALKELGRTYYPKRFSNVDESAGTPRTIRYEVIEPNAYADKT